MATAIQTQKTINQHLHSGIVMLNQRVDLLQEQVDILMDLAASGCLGHYSGLCLTGVQYHNYSRVANL